MHFELSLQSTVPLLPTVKLHVEDPLHVRLALSPAVKLQVDPPLQLPLQETPQLSAEQVPLGQPTPQLGELAEVQFAVFVHPDDPPPQPARASPSNTAKSNFIDTSRLKTNLLQLKDQLPSP